MCDFKALPLMKLRDCEKGIKISRPLPLKILNSSWTILYHLDRVMSDLLIGDLASISIR